MSGRGGAERGGAERGRAFERLVAEKDGGMGLESEGPVTSLESKGVFRETRAWEKIRKAAGLRSRARGLSD